MNGPDPLDAVFGALADPTRRAILARLAQGDARVTDLVAPFSVSQPAISRHLKVLRERGLVSATRRGINVVYSLDDPRLIQALDLLRTVLYDSLMRKASLIDQDLSP